MPSCCFVRTNMLMQHLQVEHYHQSHFPTHRVTNREVKLLASKKVGHWQSLELVLDWNFYPYIVLQSLGKRVGFCAVIISTQTRLYRWSVMQTLRSQLQDIFWSWDETKSWKLLKDCFNICWLQWLGIKRSSSEFESPIKTLNILCYSAHSIIHRCIY